MKFFPSPNSARKPQCLGAHTILFEFNDTLCVLSQTPEGGIILSQNGAQVTDGRLHGELTNLIQVQNNLIDFPELRSLHIERKRKQKRKFL